MHRIVIALLFLSMIISLTLAPVSAQSESCSRTDRAAWDGQSRFNILVLGMDRRPGARDNLNARTDAMMIVSFDPQNNRLGILDIPRDMHFAVLNMREDLLRVNTLMVEGETLQEGCGPYFAMETFQLNLGLYIDAYIAFDFVAFIDFVDAIGGITVDVPALINDPTFPDMNYGTDALYIPSGQRAMDGDLALAYARTRHGDNDYARGERQLDVVLAIRDRLNERGVVQDLVDNLPQLVNDLDGHFYSNLPPEQLSFLGLAMMTLDVENITTASLNQDYSFDYVYAGSRIRVPDREYIAELLINTFGEDYWR
ncbi:MAG: LCP family protein [Phototrophicaceae bacterium]